jgi:thioredoxin-related protein
MEVTAFMSDYVIHPDKDKSVCLDDVMVHFKTMPSLKGKVDEDDLEEISTYLYDFDANLSSETQVKYVGFDDALKVAKTTHKIIMIKVMSEGCHFCRKMERTTMKDVHVVDAVKKDFVTVTVDISKHKLPLGLKTELTPSFVFVDEDANILLNIPGAWGVDDFVEILKEAKSKNLKQKAKK